MAKRSKQVDILWAYMTAERYVTDSAFAREIGISRQALNLWKKDTQPHIQSLQDMAIARVGTWVGDMAVDLLKARGAAVPCVCQTRLGDCGPCPKHGVVGEQAVEGGMLMVDSGQFAVGVNS